MANLGARLIMRLDPRGMRVYGPFEGVRWIIKRHCVSRDLLSIGIGFLSAFIFATAWCVSRSTTRGCMC